MRLIVQKVSKSSVKIDGEVVGKINKGYMVLVGITDGDDEILVGKMVDKLVNLRIFEDENDKLNLSLLDVQGSILSISQFTLYANCKKEEDQVLLMQLNQMYQNRYMIYLIKN